MNQVGFLSLVMFINQANEVNEFCSCSLTFALTNQVMQVILGFTFLYLRNFLPSIEIYILLTATLFIFSYPL